MSRPTWDAMKMQRDGALGFGPPRVRWTEAPTADGTRRVRWTLARKPVETSSPVAREFDGHWYYLDSFYLVRD